MITSLNKIKRHNPKGDMFERVLTGLGKHRADDEPISISTMLNQCAFNDVLWCLRAVEGYEKEIRLFAVWCARQASPHMSDYRSKEALNLAEHYANGRATKQELASARAAAEVAAQQASKLYYAAYVTEGNQDEKAELTAAMHASSAAVLAADENLVTAVQGASSWARHSLVSRIGYQFELLEPTDIAAVSAQRAELMRVCSSIEAEIKLKDSETVPPLNEQTREKIEKIEEKENSAGKQSLFCLSDEEVQRTWQCLHDEKGNAPNPQDFAQALFREAALKASEQPSRSADQDKEVRAPGRAGELSELVDGLENAEKLAWLHLNVTDKNRTVEQMVEIYKRGLSALAPRITELTTLAHEQEKFHAKTVANLEKKLSSVQEELNRICNMF